MRHRSRTISALFTLLLLTATAGPSKASTLICEFGDSIGVGMRDGAWQQGAKTGRMTIRYRRDGHFARGTRQETGAEPIFGPIVVSDRSVHFIMTWGPAPASLVEVTSIEARSDAYFAVRSVHATGSIAGPSVLVDYGSCAREP